MLVKYNNVFEGHVGINVLLFTGGGKTEPLFEMAFQWTQQQKVIMEQIKEHFQKMSIRIYNGFK